MKVQEKVRVGGAREWNSEAKQNAA